MVQTNIEKRIGNIFGSTGGNHAGMVYDKNYLSPTLNSMTGGCRQPMIVVDSTQKHAFVGNGELSPTITSTMGGGVRSNVSH